MSGLSVTTKFRVLLGEFDTNLLRVIGVKSETVHLLHGGLRSDDAHKENETDGDAILVVPETC